MSEKKPKGKRGRRPKNKIVENPNANFEVDQQLNNLIIKLKKKSKVPIDDTVECYNCDHNISEIPNTTKQIQCWNCSYDINNEISMPVKFDKGVFYVFGSFCCFECCSRYLIDNYTNTDLWNKYNLLNIYYNKVLNTKTEKVPIAPHRLNLEKYGGNISKEDYYHKKEIDGDYINKIPVIPIKNEDINKYNSKTHLKHNTGDLKLYRTNPIKNKQDILNTMNINS